jgi:peptide/nickel transport system ATP-binding protein
VSDVLLSVSGLRATFRGEAGPVVAVDGVSLELRRGRTLGLVGESGSGKSVTSLSILRLLPEEAHAEGAITFAGRDLMALGERGMRDVRGDRIAMIFQEPMTSLNPVHTVGDQVAEAIVRHRRVPRSEALARTVALFREVGLPDPETRMRAFPHQLSGGQKQRVMIAMALSCDPDVLIADEPTTALDVTIQAQILALLRQLRDRRGMAMLFVTHDLGVIAEIADDVAVMYRGRIVESGPVEAIFREPAHPYTRGLLACRPRLDADWTRLPTVADFLGGGDAVAAPLRGEATPRDPGKDLLEVHDLRVHFPVRTGLFGRPTDVVKAVDGVSFSVPAGKTLGLVGESGCGKTTTGRAILRLIEPTGGSVRFDGRDLLAERGASLRRLRREMQIVFQDPFASLNPRMTLGDTLTEPMAAHGIGTTAGERTERAAALLREVGLPAEWLSRYPHELSGGQRQRICIARALSVNPRFVVCDESVSALDVSVQAQVLNLLKDLQDQRGLTYVFISHDLAVVRFMADTVAVMRAGRIVESGPADELWREPREAYTRALIAAIPDVSPERMAARRRAREAVAQP